MAKHFITINPSNKNAVKHQLWDLAEDRIHEFLGDCGDDFGIDEFWKWLGDNAHCPVFIYNGEELVFAAFLSGIAPGFSACVHWLIHPAYNNAENMQSFSHQAMHIYFEKLGVTRLEGLAPVYDRESQLQHLQIGMQQDGRFRGQFIYNGQHRDAYHYSILRGEFYAH